MAGIVEGIGKLLGYDEQQEDDTWFKQFSPQWEKEIVTAIDPIEGIGGFDKANQLMTEGIAAYLQHKNDPDARHSKKGINHYFGPMIKEIKVLEDRHISQVKNLSEDTRYEQIPRRHLQEDQEVILRNGPLVFVKKPTLGEEWKKHWQSQPDAVPWSAEEITEEGKSGTGIYKALAEGGREGERPPFPTREELGSMLMRQPGDDKDLIAILKHLRSGAGRGAGEPPVPSSPSRPTT